MQARKKNDNRFLHARLIKMLSYTLRGGKCTVDLPLEINHLVNYLACCEIKFLQRNKNESLVLNFFYKLLFIKLF